MLQLFTYKIGTARHLMGDGVTIIDCTVATGEQHLAPDWDMVRGIHQKTLSEEVYTREYLALLNFRYMTTPELFDHYFTIPKIAFGCYCQAGQFCHRHLLVNWLKDQAEENGCEVRIEGEVT